MADAHEQGGDQVRLSDANLMEIEPYDIDGVRPLAKMCGIELSREASSAEVQQKLFPVWGTETAFIENAPTVAAALKLEAGVIPDAEALYALKATGILDRIPLRNYKDTTPPAGSVIFVYRGAVANWMERGAREGDHSVTAHRLQPAATLLIASERFCQKDSELNNFYVKQFRSRHGRYPTEADLLPVIVKHFTGQEREVEVVEPNQAEQIRQLIKLHPEIASGRVYIPTNAVATYVPLQIRRVIREQFGSFDEKGDQFWFSQDGFRLATRPTDAENTAVYQRPLTAFSGLVRLVNELCLLQGR
ncbi:MAG TPA: hypothetical protein VHD84_02775 [Candidatus Saccharimonadales bacterium]|nr:hypothetical protein [Candidatus Saccharimonadales bacterium]